MNYLIDMHDRWKTKRLFHINMLREYLPSAAVSTSYWSESGTDVDEDDEIPVWKEESVGVVQYGPQLTEQQRTDLDSLIREFAQVLATHQEEPSSQNIVLRQGRHALCDFLPIKFPMP